MSKPSQNLASRSLTHAEKSHYPHRNRSSGRRIPLLQFPSLSYSVSVYPLFPFLSTVCPLFFAGNPFLPPPTVSPHRHPSHCFAFHRPFPAAPAVLRRLSIPSFASQRSFHTAPVVFHHLPISRCPSLHRRIPHPDFFLCTRTDRKTPAADGCGRYCQVSA